MDDDTRTELRRGLEALVRAAEAESRRAGYCSVTVSRSGAAGGGRVWQSVYLKVDDTDDLPPLTPAQQLALSVLLQDDAVVPQVLADFLLDHGHEYATAVAARAADEARAEERRRCVEAVRFATTQMRVLVEVDPDAPLSPHGVVELFEWARGEIERPGDLPAGA
jgi:hypothetical protein